MASLYAVVELCIDENCGTMIDYILQIEDEIYTVLKIISRAEELANARKKQP